MKPGGGVGKAEEGGGGGGGSEVKECRRANTSCLVRPAGRQVASPRTRLSLDPRRPLPAQTVSVTACLNFPTGRSDTANSHSGTARALARSLARSLTHIISVCVILN